MCLRGKLLIPDRSRALEPKVATLFPLQLRTLITVGLPSALQICTQHVRARAKGFGERNHDAVAPNVAIELAKHGCLFPNVGGTKVALSPPAVQHSKQPRYIFFKAVTKISRHFRGRTEGVRVSLFFC